MNRETAETANEALNHVNDLIANGELVIFSAAEANALREMALVWGQLKAVVSLGGTLGKGLKWFIVFAGMWVALKGGLLEWIRSNLNQ